MKQKSLSRRTFLRSVGAGGATLLMAACGAAPEAAAPSSSAATESAAASAAPAVSSAPTSSTAAVASVPPAQAPVTLSMATWVDGPVDNNNLVKQWVKQRLNIDLQMLAFERSTWQDQINTRVAGGDVPDIIYRDDQGRLSQFVDQGILAEVPYAAVKQYAPKTFAAANEFNPDVWFATNYEAKNYGVPIQQPRQLHPFSDAWRKDWLDTAGIAKAPETLDEYAAAFDTLTKQSPAGSGPAFAMSGRGKDIPHWTFHSFFGAHGTFPHMWMRNADGTLTYGGVSDGARQTMALLADWYAKGYIDPEFVTTDSKALTEQWANSKAGYLPLSTWNRLIPGGEHYDALRAVSPDALIEIASPPRGPDGMYGYFNWGPVTSGIAFGKQLEGSDQLPRALEFVELLMADPELAILLRFGNEGEMWERQAEHGAITPTTQYAKSEQRGPLGTTFFNAIPPIPAIQADMYRKDEPQLYAKAEMNKVTNFEPFAGLFVPSDTGKIGAELITNLQGPAYLDFITGARSLDQWDAYVEEWSSGGGADVTTATNESFAQIESERARIKAATSGE